MSTSCCRPRSSWPRGQTIVQVSNALGITEQTYYRSRKEYGGIKSDQALRLMDLERENAQLNRLLAEAELDTDQATATLVIDLKRRGLLDDVLVVWGGEFGRTVWRVEK